jgi:hypothetical protein
LAQFLSAISVAWNEASTERSSASLGSIVIVLAGYDHATVRVPERFDNVSRTRCILVQPLPS